VLADGLAPVRFADDAGAPTEAYPLNPNGSPHGITALTFARRPPPRPDAPPRANLPEVAVGLDAAAWRSELASSPWLRLFQNAREWCEEE